MFRNNGVSAAPLGLVAVGWLACSGDTDLFTGTTSGTGGAIGGHGGASGGGGAGAQGGGGGGAGGLAGAGGGAAGEGGIAGSGGTGPQTVDCAGNGMDPFEIEGVTFCYTVLPGTCEEAHLRCEGLGQGYRLMCGDDWQPGSSGEGCGNAGAFTAYDIVVEFFQGAPAIGSASVGLYDCVFGPDDNQCFGDVGMTSNVNANGRLAFCSPKNYFTEQTDGQAFANVCGH